MKVVKDFSERRLNLTEEEPTQIHSNSLKLVIASSNSEISEYLKYVIYLAVKQFSRCVVE